MIIKLCFVLLVFTETKTGEEIYCLLAFQQFFAIEFPPRNRIPHFCLLFASAAPLKAGMVKLMLSGRLEKKSISILVSHIVRLEWFAIVLLLFALKCPPLYQNLMVLKTMKIVEGNFSFLEASSEMQTVLAR